MAAQLIDGKQLAQQHRRAVMEAVNARTHKGLRPPSLAVVLVGDDPASHIYVGLKEKACASVGISSQTLRFPATVTQQELEQVVQRLNHDKSIDSILVQLPLPKHIDKHRILDGISPGKDVDGLTPANQGLLAWNRPGIYPCTPLGIMELIRSTQVPIVGKQACVVGASVLVGGSTAKLLTHAAATVVTLHSRSLHKAEIARQADILVVATGVRGLVTREWVKPGAVVIDVGMHRHEGKVVGDVVFDEVKQLAGFITPVPGGVGPMTIAMLLANVVKTATQH